MDKVTLITQLIKGLACKAWIARSGNLFDWICSFFQQAMAGMASTSTTKCVYKL